MSPRKPVPPLDPKRHVQVQLLNCWIRSSRGADPYETAAELRRLVDDFETLAMQPKHE
jgi:hypothetical protein